MCRSGIGSPLSERACTSRPAHVIALFEGGVYTNVALHPAVPPGGALLRTSLMANHERDQLDRALEIFADVIRRFPDLPMG